MLSKKAQLAFKESTASTQEMARMLPALWFLWLVSKKPHHATLSKKARNHSLVSKKPQICEKTNRHWKWDAWLGCGFKETKKETTA